MDKKLTAAAGAESSKQTRAMDLSRGKKRTAAATLVSSKLEAVALSLKRFRWMPEKLNPEDLWLSTFNVGIRWDDFDQTKEFNWNFENLEAALKRGGKLYEKRLHLFGSTEPQLLDINGTVRKVHVPVVVAVDCPFTPLSTIGFTPLTLDGEDSYIRITYPLEPPMVWEFDWEMDDCEELAHNVDLPENKKEKLKSLLKAVQERKRRAKIARKKAIDAMDPETKKAYENIIFYKFYPVKTSDTPGVELKSKYIGEIGRNAFYRNAHHLM